MEKYEINKNTTAVIGVGEKSSIIYEMNKNYIINDNSFSIMDHSCEYYGSTYRGRLIGSKNMLGLKYKLPIIVEESNNIIFFPICDIENIKCIWISLNWFDRVEEKSGKSYIYLKNGRKTITTVSKYSIENQVLRSSKLNLVLNSRKI